MTWTTRLKRHGGLRAIEGARARQFDRIRTEFSKVAFYRRNALKAIYDWLNEHPLRVMSKADEDFFWPPQDAQQIVDIFDARYNFSINPTLEPNP